MKKSATKFKTREEERVELIKNCPCLKEEHKTFTNKDVENSDVWSWECEKCKRGVFVRVY